VLIDHDKLTKLYYSIGEVSDMFDVSASLVRFWETEFPKLKPKKDRRGDRRYMKKDILMLEKIYILVKERGFTLEGARKELSSSKSDNKLELKKKLNNLKNRLLDLKSNLETDD